MTFDLDHTFVTSDHHFGSSKLLGPFKVFNSSQELELVSKWNSIVKPNDFVIYNGDFCDDILMEAMKWKSMLNGHVVLVRGNHDTFSDDIYRALFDDVFNEIVLDKSGIVIHHKPDESLKCGQIYGHMHRGYVIGPLDKSYNFCSCVQAHDGYPVLLREAVESVIPRTSQASC